MDLKPEMKPIEVCDKLVEKGLIPEEDREEALLVLTWGTFGKEKAKEAVSDEVYEKFKKSGFVDEEGKLITFTGGPDVMWFMMAVQGAKGELDVNDLRIKA